MLEIWASLKVFTEYIIPFFILVMCIIFLAITILASSLKWDRKIKLLKSYGYKRYLIGVPSVGGGAFYGWENEQTGDHIDERELRVIKIDTLRERIMERKPRG